jgi:DNA-binding NarL/FixJ family response regulator
MIRVLLVDDHPAVRAGYVRFLEQDGDITVVAEAACVPSGYSAYVQHMPDVTLSDISLPHVSGLELLRKIKQRWGHGFCHQKCTARQFDRRRQICSRGPTLFE